MARSAADPAADPAPNKGEVKHSYQDVLLNNVPQTETCKVRSLNVSSCVVEPVVRVDLDPEEEALLDEEGECGPETAAPEGQGRKKRKVEEKTSWLSARTHRRLQDAILFETEECRVCGLHLPEKRLKVHIRQHYVQNYCKCGLRRLSRDGLLDHLRDRRGDPAHSRDVIECDQDSFQELKTSMGWGDSVEFPPCVPTLAGPGRAMLADTRMKIQKRRQEREVRFKQQETREVSRKKEKVAERIKRESPRVTTSPPRTKDRHSEVPVIRVRRLTTLEEEPTESRSRVQTCPLPSTTGDPSQENDWMWNCMKAAATLETEADQLEDKVAALRRRAKSFRDMAKRWRPTPRE